MGKKHFIPYCWMILPGWISFGWLYAKIWKKSFGESDQAGLTRVIDRRRRESERYFDEVAERLGKNYVPGRSWDAIGHFLLRLVPQINIADLGAGEGTISQLLAERAKKVFCIDSSKSMVRLGTDLAKKKNLSNLIYKQGDIEEVPLPAKSVGLGPDEPILTSCPAPRKSLSRSIPDSQTGRATRSARFKEAPI
jgi:ArsR family transcriptional regulator